MPILVNASPPSCDYFYISSKDRLFKENGQDTSDFKVLGVTPYRPYKVILHRIAFVNTIYNVNRNNNTLFYGLSWNQIKEPAAQTKSSISITPGQYTIDQFIAPLQAALRTAYGQNDIVVNYDANTFKISILSPTAPLILYNSGVSGTTMNTILGMDDRVPVFGNGYPTDQLAVGTTTYFGNVFNLAGYTNIFLCSDYLARSASIYVSNPGLSNVACMIPMSQYYFGDKVDYSPEHVFNWSQPGDIDFRLADDLGNTVDLNGSDVEVSLILTRAPE